MAVFGKEWRESVLPLDVEDGGMSLKGYIGRPGVSRATRAEQILFVNGRPVQNMTLNAALLEGYHNALMRGRFPVAVLFLEVDPAGVDVNVHPAKREVRFRQDGDVRRFVSGAVAEVLRGGSVGPPVKTPQTPCGLHGPSVGCRGNSILPPIHLCLFYNQEYLLETFINNSNFYQKHLQK